MNINNYWLISIGSSALRGSLTFTNSCLCLTFFVTPKVKSFGWIFLRHIFLPAYTLTCIFNWAHGTFWMYQAYILKRQWWRNIKLFEPLMKRHCFQKTNLFVSNLVTFLSCFDENLFIHQVVLSFTVAFREFFN